MTIQGKARRRAVTLALIAVIAIACGSVLRTAVERGLISTSTVLKFWAVASPRAADRAYYRLQAENEAFHQELDGMLAQYTDTVPPEIVRHVRQRRRELLVQFEDFTRRHSNHVLGLVAHADLLAESGSVARALDQREKAARLAGNDPLLWREYADRCLHFGDVHRAFYALEQVVRLQPRELAALRDLADALFLYRPDAMSYYRLTEAEVFDRSLGLLRHARDLYPQNPDLARDLANCYYTIKPPRDAEAVEAWDYVRRIALDEYDRQNACLHMARFLLKSGEPDRAAQLLDRVTLPAHALHKGRVQRNIALARSLPADATVVPASFTD